MSSKYISKTIAPHVIHFSVHTLNEQVNYSMKAKFSSALSLAPTLDPELPV